MQEVERPQADKRKIHSKNEFELCYIRHQYFRRVKYNPTAEEMLPYKNIIKYLSQRTFYTYQKLFHIVGMTYEDVNSIGQINLVNFLGLFEIGPEKNVEKYLEFLETFKHKYPNVQFTKSELLSKNKANLTLFMKQRMEDLVRICKQKAKNIKGARVDEYIAFYGPTPPPADLHKLIEDNEAYGYRRVDNVTFKAYRKSVKAKKDTPFQKGGFWYVTVAISQRPLTWEDLAGAGFDPRDNEHNLNPEEVLLRNHDELKLDKNIKMFKTATKEVKIKTLMSFVEKYIDDVTYTAEINTAKRLLKTMGIVDVG